MNKNSNTYQIAYAAVMVLIVGAVLAFIYMALKPKQDENVANDKRKQILSSLCIAADNDATVPETYARYVVADYLVDNEGNVVDSTANVAFDVDMKKNIKSSERVLPVFKAVLDDGSVKYVVPMYGAGLWGPIWGYVAVNSDGRTIYGANFSHEGETPGLGARITEQSFQDQFKEKSLYRGDEFIGVDVVKSGQPAEGDYVDALSGATITSRGVGSMLQDCLKHYDGFFKKLQQSQPLNP